MDLTEKIINNKYKVKERIGEGGMSVVWLAEDLLKKENVVIKVLKRGVTSNRAEDIIRFRNEAITVSKLNEPGIVKIFEIGEVENMHYIIMEYIKGKSLYKLLEDGVKFSPLESVEIIYRIGEALKHIHNANVIHRDLKPGNIIINWESGGTLDIKLIDFGLAQVKEFNLKDTGEIIGTLSYMAPEQSGIIKRSVDERSDLYSLGIIFYQLLTGELPFKAENVNSLIHQQIAKTPERITKFAPSLPGILEKINLKLLEKEPEKRYQSAAGLLSDLEKFKKGQCDFVPGIDDKYIKLNYRTKLIGRDEELSKLKILLDNALKGKGSICLIGGEAGRGKTRLAEELRNYVYEKNGMFIDGKCFSGKNKIPYGPFKDALNLYIKEFEKKYNDEMKGQIRGNIKSFIGDLGELVLKLNPMLEEIIGQSPPLIELSPEKENKRFLMIVCQFLYSLGRIENVLVILLDNLQWADEGSMELLDELLKEISLYPVLLIGTYRDNEITKERGLRNFILNTKNDNLPLTDILLKPFDQKQVNKFVANLLFDDEENSLEISDFILQKSKGNPFFVVEILKQLIDEKVIIRKDEKWTINKEAFEKTEIPSTIVDILIKKVSLFNDKENAILSYAAVIGRKFDIEILFLLGEMGKEEVVKAVDKAIQLQLLEENVHERGTILFIHDRIREVFYKTIGEERRKGLHLRIARAIEEKCKDDLEKYIFDLAHHYIEGGEKEKILQYAFPAGKKAKENFAYEEALKYLMLVKNLYEEKNLKNQTLWIECMKIIGEIYASYGKLDEAIAIQKELLPNLVAPLEKLIAYKQISHIYLRKGDWRKCEEYGRLGLGMVGEKLPVGNLWFKLAILKEATVHLWHMLFPAFYSQGAAGPKNEIAAQTIQLYYVLSSSFSLIGNLRFFTVLRMVNLSESRIGKSQELGLSLIAYALYLAELTKFRQSIKYYKSALKLMKELDDALGLAYCYCNIGYYYKCKGEYQASIDCFKENLNIIKKIGDISEIGEALSGLVGVNINLGDYDNAAAVNHQYHELAVKFKSTFGHLLVGMHDALIGAEKGEYDKAERCAIKVCDLAYETKDMYMYCITSVVLGQLYIEMGAFKKAISYLERAQDIFQNNNFLMEYAVRIFPYLAEAYVNEYLNEKSSLSKKEAEIYLKKLKKSCREALEKTKKWVTYHVCSIRVNAKYYSLIGNNAKAEKMFLESIKLSKNLGRKYELAIGYYEYGRFLEQTGKASAARQNLENAYLIFNEINSVIYKQRIADILGISDDGASSIERLTKELRHTHQLSSMVRLTQDISSILNLDELLERIMLIAIEVTGAQRGFIISVDHKTGNLIVSANKNINENISQRDGFSKNIVNEVLQNGQTIVTTNAMNDERYLRFQSVISYELKSVLCLPIKYNNEVKGVCYLDNPLSSAVFNEEDIEVLNTIMTQAAISIENATLYKLAITDGLTELFTHKHFLYLLGKEIERAKRYKRTVSLIMFDIDHFKKFNDTYGHQAGDQILAKIGIIVKENLRTLDIVGRYGGEEFAIVLPETDRLGAEITAERLRKSIEKASIHYNDMSLNVTVSLGIAEFPYHTSNMENLIKLSDEAMYCSKKNGRNRVTVYSNT